MNLIEIEQVTGKTIYINAERILTVRSIADEVVIADDHRTSWRREVAEIELDGGNTYRAYTSLATIVDMIREPANYAE